MLTALLVLELQHFTAVSCHCGLSSFTCSPKQAETSFQSLEPDTADWISILALLFQELFAHLMVVLWADHL